MARILLVADEPWVRNEVHAALTEPDFSIVDHEDPRTAAARVDEVEADTAVVDLQIGSMGGMAVTRSIREQAAIRGGGDPAIVMLLDRKADAFLARRAGADAWVVKPFTPQELRDAVSLATERATMRVGG